MARADALQKLQQTLVKQRDAIKRKLASEISATDSNCTGDSGDHAIFDTEQEMHSQLAALESRELRRIEHALESIEDGTYGNCEGCNKPIPVTRLKALPHTNCCIECQREFELHGNEISDDADWEGAYEFQARENDRELTSRDVKIVGD